MKTKELILSLVASTLVYLPSSFAEQFHQPKELKQAKNTRFELYPVKLVDTEEKNSMEFEGKYLLQVTKKPLAVLEDFQYQAFVGTQPGVKLLVNEKTGKALEKLSRRYINTRLALVHNGKVIMAPNIKSIIKGDSLQITFKDQNKFAAVLNSFKGQ